MSCVIMAGTPQESGAARQPAESRADSLVARARDAATRDDHVDAMRWFREALDVSPERRPEWFSIHVADRM